MSLRHSRLTGLFSHDACARCAPLESSFLSPKKSSSNYYFDLHRASWISNHIDAYRRKEHFISRNKSRNCFFFCLINTQAIDELENINSGAYDRLVRMICLIHHYLRLFCDYAITSSHFISDSQDYYGLFAIITALLYCCLYSNGI